MQIKNDYNEYGRRIERVGDDVFLLNVNGDRKKIGTVYDDWNVADPGKSDREFSVGMIECDAPAIVMRGGFIGLDVELFKSVKFDLLFIKLANGDVLRITRDEFLLHSRRADLVYYGNDDDDNNEDAYGLTKIAPEGAVYLCHAKHMRLISL